MNGRLKEVKKKHLLLHNYHLSTTGLAIHLLCKRPTLERVNMNFHVKLNFSCNVYHTVNITPSRFHVKLLLLT